MCIDVSRANSYLYDIWKEQLLFTFEWWIALALIIIPWTIWIILHKKQSRSRVLVRWIFRYHRRLLAGFYRKHEWSMVLSYGDHTHHT